MRLSRRATIVVVALVLMMGAAIGAARWWNDTHPTGIKGAVAALPATTQSFQFTDWSAVRIELRVMQGQEISKLGTWLDPSTYAATSTSPNVLRTLSSTSIISTPDSAMQLQKQFGISPANLQWEAYGNLPAGGVEVLSPNATVDLTKVRSALTAAGYVQTKSGAWSLEGGSANLPDFGNIAVLPDRHLVLASASPIALTDAMQTASGKVPSLDSVTSLNDLVGTLDQPVAADVWVRDAVCGDTRISYSAQAAPDPATEQEINQAIRSAGGVSPLVGFALTLNPDGTLTAAMQYPSDSAAQRDLKARATLATGQRYSIGVNFASLFTLVSSQTNNSTILLQMSPVPGSESSTGVPLFPWLIQGDLDFASC
ncbi:MAG TPA: hypothetical protein VN108_07070 [Marmoricola sp.]|nr:hypothetical protein [Marmoricola sp.]